ncbi:hypothetical protein ACLOJK_005340 [Asimina triloba]
MLLNASLVSVSEILSTIIEQIFETIAAARDVLFEKESFEKLASYLERIVPVLRELIKKNVRSSESLNNVSQILNKEIKIANQQALNCSKRNKVYLIVNCRKIAKRLQQTTREISRAMSLMPLASLDLSSSINEEVERLRKLLPQMKLYIVCYVCPINEDDFVTLAVVVE